MFVLDIKPANVLINTQGECKLADFGVCREVNTADELAQANTFIGTLAYMSPERIGGGTYSYPADVWSLGLTVVTVACGVQPVTHQAGRGYWALLHE